MTYTVRPISDRTAFTGRHKDSAFSASWTDTEALLERLPVTIQLGMAAWVFAISLAIPLGVLAAISRNTWKDQAATAFALAGVATPSFWMGLMLILLFAVSAYFYGFSMFDYVFERRRMRIGESVKAVNDRSGAVLANGALFSLLMKLPLAGVMLAPVMASIGAVLRTMRMNLPAVTRSGTSTNTRKPSL